MYVFFSVLAHFVSDRRDSATGFSCRIMAQRRVHSGNPSPSPTSTTTTTTTMTPEVYHNHNYIYMEGILFHIIYHTGMP